MQSPRVYFNNIGSICSDSLRHGNGLSALLLLTRAAKSSAAKSSASKTRSMESRLYAVSVCNYLPITPATCVPQDAVRNRQAIQIFSITFIDVTKQICFNFC